MILFRNTIIQLAEAIFIFQVFDAREVGMAHCVVAVVQCLDPLVEHYQQLLDVDAHAVVGDDGARKN